MGGGILKTAATLMICMLLFGFVYDVKKAQSYKHEIKNTLDISTKAAALQIDMTPSKIAEGIFDIDIQKATSVFKEYVKENLGGNSLVYVTDITIINAHRTQTYINNGKTYTIDCPTIFASVKYKYNGLFINKTIEVNTLSGSQVKNKNDIKK